MVLPDYQAIMLPLLRIGADGQEHSMEEARKRLAEEFKLTDEEWSKVLPSGNEPVFHNRVGWARTYLKRAGLLTAPRRAHFQLTERGLKVLRDGHQRVDTAFLWQFPEFREFKQRAPTAENESATPATAADLTPEEAVGRAMRELRRSLEAEVLQRVKDASPRFFEQLVVDLLLKMGYGGPQAAAGLVTGRSGDRGVDGLINQDTLGLDRIYVQAKRWDGSVGGKEIRDFMGALTMRGARKGVFLTTGACSREARESVAMNPEVKVVLIDGPDLARFMVDYNLGVTVRLQHEIKQLDVDYFSDDEA